MIMTMLPSWDKEKWMVMATLTMTHLCNGMVVSLQAPFYPAEAEKKGATGTEYGLVFGIFELTVFIVSPVIGKYLPRIGISRGFSGGISTTGLMCVAFGFLDRITNGKTFIALSFVIRIVEACGNSVFLAASFTLVAMMFPNSVSTVFGMVEMSFGVGMILGPTVGGALFQAGGFTMPFAVLGGILLVQAAVSTQTLPRLKSSSSSEASQEGNFGIMQALRIPSVLLAILAVFAASIGVGAFQTTLERHLSQFDLSPMHIGMFFMVYGGSYALLNPVWGRVADKISSKLVIMVGSFLLGLGYLLVGPVPGLGIQSSYNLCMVSVVLVGLGVGAQLVAAFSEAQTSAVASGFPDTINTYALVSSIWTSSFALGAFVGPTAAGTLYEVVGFEWSTMFTVGWNVAVFIAALNGLLAVGFIKFSSTARRQGMYSSLDRDRWSKDKEVDRWSKDKEVDKLTGKTVYSYQSV